MSGTTESNNSVLFPLLRSIWSFQQHLWFVYANIFFYWFLWPKRNLVETCSKEENIVIALLKKNPAIYSPIKHSNFLRLNAKITAIKRNDLIVLDDLIEVNPFHSHAIEHTASFFISFSAGMMETTCNMN